MKEGEDSFIDGGDSGVNDHLLSYKEYFPLTEWQYKRAEVLGISHQRLQGIQKRMIAGRGLYKKIFDLIEWYEKSKENSGFHGKIDLPNTLWGESYSKLVKLLIEENTGDWKEQFLTMYYYIDLTEEEITKEQFHDISIRIEKYRSYLFRINLFYEIPELKYIPTHEELSHIRKENNKLYLRYINLARQYYETFEKEKSTTYMPCSDVPKGLFSHTLQKGEKTDIHTRVFPNMGIIPHEKMERHVDFFEEIQILGGAVPYSIQPSEAIVDAFIERHADRLEQNIDALDPAVSFGEDYHAYVGKVIQDYRVKQKNLQNKNNTNDVISGVQKKVQNTTLVPQKLLPKEKIINYKYPLEINKKGISKKYHRKAFDLVNRWEILDKRKLWIFSLTEKTWKSYTRDEEISSKSMPSGVYEFCFAFENPENKNLPEEGSVRIKYTIENEKISKGDNAETSSKSMQTSKKIVQETKNLLTIPQRKDLPEKKTELNDDENEALEIFSLLEEGEFSIKNENEKFIFTFSKVNFSYFPKEGIVDSKNPFILDLCGDIFQKKVEEYLLEREQLKKENKEKEKEKYIEKQLDEIHTIDVGIMEFFDTFSMGDILFGEYVSNHDDILSTFRSTTGGFIGSRFLNQIGEPHHYRIILQKILYQDGTKWGFSKIRNENGSFELKISLERKNGSHISIESLSKKPYYTFSFPDGIDYRIEEGLSQVLKNILILVGEISRRSMFGKTTKEYRGLPDKKKMEAYISGNYKEEHAWGKLSGKSKNIQLEAYRRLISQKGAKTIDSSTGHIKTGQGINDIFQDTKIIVHDMSIKPGFTAEGSKKAYEIIRSGEHRLKKYLMKRIFSTLHQSTVDGKRIFSNGMGSSFQSFWKELSENTRKELIDISQTGEDSTQRAMKIQHGEKNLIDALLDYWESHCVLLSISNPSYILGRDILDNISFLDSDR